MTTRREDLAWAAGFLVGEGTVYFRQRGGPDAYCPQAEREPLERLVKIFGGTIYGPTPPRGLGTKEMYEWRLSGFAEVQNAVAQMWSWLSPRRREQWGGAIKQTAARKSGWQRCSALGHKITKNGEGYPFCQFWRRKGHTNA